MLVSFDIDCGYLQRREARRGRSGRQRGPNYTVRIHVGGDRVPFDVARTQDVVDTFLRDCLGKEEALRSVALGLLHRLQLIGVLDALGDDVETERTAEPDQRVHERSALH